jgi:hypothetical protein
MSAKRLEKAALLGFCLLLAVSFLPAAESLAFPAYADFSFLVNDTWAMTPRLKGYGMDNWEPLTLQAVMWYEDFTGKAVVLDTPNHGISPETIARRTLANATKNGWGKPALIMQVSAGGVAGFGEFARDFSDVSDIGIPCVDVSVAIYYLAQYTSDNKIPLTVIVRDDDPNPITFFWSFPTALFCAIFLSACCIACFVVNAYKFYLHLRRTRGITTAKVFFVIDDAANFMRFWYVCINPFFVNRFAYTWTTMCTTTHISLSIICTLLLALKWRELLLKSKMKVVMFLQTFKWPFFAASSITFAVEAVSSAMRGHWFDITKLSQISWSFLIIMCFAVITLLYISGIQVLTQISKAVGSKRRVLQLSQTTILILVSGLFILLWGVIQMTYMIRRHALNAITNPKEVQILNVIQLFGLFFASLLQNWAMPIPGVDTPNGSTKRGSKTDRTTSTARESSVKPTHSTNTNSTSRKTHDANPLDSDDSTSSNDSEGPPIGAAPKSIAKAARRASTENSSSSRDEEAGEGDEEEDEEDEEDEEEDSAEESS